MLNVVIKKIAAYRNLNLNFDEYFTYIKEQYDLHISTINDYIEAFNKAVYCFYTELEKRQNNDKISIRKDKFAEMACYGKD